MSANESCRLLKMSECSSGAPHSQEGGIRELSYRLRTFRTSQRDRCELAARISNKYGGVIDLPIS